MFREQCQANKFLLRHENPKDFSICCWQKVQETLPVWIGYRACLFAYFFCSMLHYFIWWPSQDDVTKEDKPKLLIYLTVWTYFIETLLFFWGLVVAAVDYAKERRGTDIEETSIIAKVFWVHYNIVLPCSVLVTLVFWTGVYDKKTFSLNPSNIMMHITNSAIMVIDFFLVAFPYRFLHFYMPLIYLLVYCTFSVIYEMSGGTGPQGTRPIYKILDWKQEPLKTVPHIFLVCLVAMVAHILFSLLYMLKVWLWEKYIIQEE